MFISRLSLSQSIAAADNANSAGALFPLCIPDRLEGIHYSFEQR